MVQYVFVNGAIVPKEEAKVSVLDHSFLYGNGIFETLRSYKGKVFRLKAHLDRLYRSATALHLKNMPERHTFTKGIYTLLQKNKYQEAYIRITVSRGVGEPGLHPDLCHQPNVVIYAKPFLPYADERYSNGVKAVIVSTMKPYSGSIGIPFKSCNYLFNFLAKEEARLQGGLEGIMLSGDGLVAEGSISNVFMVNSDTLKTPIAGETVLDGITRGCVIDLASQNKIRILEANITPDELYQAEECFLTNTTFEVLPVTQIGDQTIGNGKPGRISKLLKNLYTENLAKELFT